MCLRYIEDLVTAEASFRLRAVEYPSSFQSIWLKSIYFSIIMPQKGSAKILAKKKFENEKSKNKEKQRNT